MAGITITVGGNDITAYVDVESIFVEEVGGALVATCGFTVKDHSGTVSISTKDAIDIDDDGTTLFAGEVASVAKRQEGVTRLFVVRGQDYNILLEETAVASESYAAGVADSYILGNATYGLFPQYRSDIDATTYVSTLDASMEAVAFVGMTLREILDDLARRTSGRYYVDYDKKLHWFTTESNPASFSLSTSPDLVSSWPFGGFSKTEEVTRLADKVFVLGKEVSAWHPGGAPPYDGTLRHAVSRDQRITTAQGITDRGTAIVDRFGNARAIYELWTEKDGLRAGQSVTVVNATWGISSSFYIRKLRMEVIGTDGEKRRYHLVLNDEEPSPARRARSSSLTIATLETQVNSIGDTVFDSDAPATPTFGSGNVTTGVAEDADGHQMAWLQITWGAVSDSDLDRYQVQVSTSSDFSGYTITRDHPPDGGRTERFEGLLGNTTYYIRVRAVDWVGNVSAWSGTESKLTAADTQAPSDPTSVTAVATPVSVHVNWDANSEADLAHYEIQRKPDGGAYSDLATLNTTFFIDNTVSVGTDYWYQVRAVDTSGNASNYVEIASAVGPAEIGVGEVGTGLQGWSHDMVFSATDHNTVAWASGTIEMASGDSYSIDAGNTGDISATTYIYLDTDVSETVLQTTTTAATAVGQDKVLVAVAKNVASGKSATFTVFGGQAAQGVLIGTDMIEDGAVTSAITTLSVRGWSHDLVFSASDHNTVAWASGTITMGDGTAYSIDAGNTGNISATTYIYLDIDVSTTVLQTTTTASSAVADNKILVAVAQDVASGKDAIYHVFGGPGLGSLITAGTIAAGTITGDEIAANTITASNIQAATITADKLVGIGDMLFTEADGLLLLGPGCEITDTSWTSLRGQAATISGAFHQEAGRWMGTWGLVIEEAGLNYELAPRMIEDGATGLAAGWLYWDNLGSGGDATLDVVVHPISERGWLQRITYTGAAGDVGHTISLYDDTAVGSFAQDDYCTFSVDLKGAAVGCTARLKIGERDAAGVAGTNHLTNITPTAQLQRFEHTVQLVDADCSKVRVEVTTAGVDNGDELDVYFGAVDCEKKAYPTSFCCGALDWCAWSGDEDDSTSTRTATTVDLDAHVGLISGNDTQSHHIVVQMMYDYDDYPASQPLFHANGGDQIYVYYDYATYKVTVYNGTANILTSSALSFSAGDFLMVDVTFDYSADEYKLYVNRILEDTNTDSYSAPTLTAWQLGAVSTGTGQISIVVFEYAVLDRVVTASELAAVYASDAPLVDAGSLDAPGLYILNGRIRIASGFTGVRLDLNATRIFIGDGPDYNSGAGVWIGIDGGVAKAFIGNSAGNKLLWNGTTLTIVGEGSGVTNIDGGNIQTGTVTADAIVANTITASEIAVGTITASEIQANTIGADQIAANTITADQIAANTITASEIAANTITASEIAASTITATELNVSTLSAITADMGTLTAGEIRVGTGSVGVNFTGFRIISSYIAGYNNDTIQAGIRASDGKLVAGGGDVTLDANGVTFAAGVGVPNKVQWKDGATLLGEIWTWDNDPTAGDLWVAARDKDGTCNAAANLLASSDSYADAYVRVMSGKSGADFGAIYLNADYNEVMSNSLFRVGTGTSDPTTALGDGCLFYRTDTDKLRLRANGAWVDLN